MCSNQYLIFLLNVFCVLQLCIGVSITPSQQLPSELFKPIKPNGGASDDTEINTKSGGAPTNPSPQTFNTPQQSFTRPNNGVNQGFNRPHLNQVQGFNIPEIIRPNNFIGPGHPQQIFNNPNVDQNGYVQNTFTVPGSQNQPSYTVTRYQSPTYHHTWSYSSDGGPTESFSSDGPPPFRIPNGFGVNDISFEDNPFGDGFNGGTQTHRSGYHTVRTTGPDGRVREKTTVW